MDTHSAGDEGLSGQEEINGEKGDICNTFNNKEFFKKSKMHVIILGVATKRIAKDYPTNTVIEIIKYACFTQEKKRKNRRRI